MGSLLGHHDADDLIGYAFLRCLDVEVNTNDAVTSSLDIDVVAEKVANHIT